MKKQSILWLSAILVLLGAASCSDDDKSMPTYSIRSVKTSANVDLTKRADWKFYVGLAEYDYTVDGYNLTATPKSEKETWVAGDHTILPGGGYGGYGSAGYFDSKNGQGGMLVTQLVSPSYHVRPDASARSVEEVKDQLDQSTPEKMLQGDLLTSWYPIVGSEHIEGVELNHENCLVQYTLVGLPEGVKPTLTSGSFKIEPLTVDKVTKAILAHPDNNKLTVKIDDKDYAVELGKAFEALVKGSATFARNQHYTFELKYDAAATDNIKRLTIQNLKVTKWSSIDEGLADK